MMKILKKSTAVGLIMVFCLILSQPAKAEVVSKWYNNYQYYALNSDSVMVCGYRGNGKQITVPSEIKGKKVTGVSGMKKASKVKTIIRPKYASSCELSEAPALTAIKVVSGNPYLTVQKNCVIKDHTTLLTYPGGLRKLDDMPSCIIKIGNAFSNSNIETVVFSKNVRRLGVSAFNGCTKLKSVKLNTQLRYIGNHAFEGCTSLREIKLGKNVLTIEPSAFENSGLKKIVIKNPSCYIASYAIPSKAVIYGYKNSTAQEYARANGNVFVALD